jgi:hypothetical protein
MAPINREEASVALTGLRCDHNDCHFLSLKRKEMTLHHAELHEGVVKESSCTVRKGASTLQEVNAGKSRLCHFFVGFGNNQI